MNTFINTMPISEKANIFYAEIVPIFAKHSLSRAIYVAAKLKIAELLENGPMDLAQISERLNCKSDLLLRILNYVSSKGIFEKDSEGRFANTETSLQLKRQVFGDAIIDDQDRNWRRLGSLSSEFKEALSTTCGVEENELWSLGRGYLLSRAIFASAVLGIDSIYKEEPYHTLLKKAGLVIGDELTPQGKILRDPGCREFFKHETEERWHALGELEMAAMEGKIPFIELYGKSFFEYLKSYPEKMQNFDKSMTFITECELATLKPNIETHFAPGQTIVDVGGGHGKFLTGLLEGHPEVLGILFDLKDTVENHEIPAKFQNQVAIWAGNFFESIPKGDIYVIKRVLHDWNDQECLVILKKCRESMKPQAKLLINEFALPHPVAAGIDVNMMTLLSGRQRTVDEFISLCAEAGWKVIDVAPAACGITTFTAI